MKFTIYSDRPAEELLADLAQRLGPEPKLANFRAYIVAAVTGKKVFGVVDGPTFRVGLAPRVWRSRFDPACWGRITSSGGGAEVSLDIRPKTLDLIDFFRGPVMVLAFAALVAAGGEWRVALWVLLGGAVLILSSGIWERRLATPRKEQLFRFFEDLTGRNRQEWMRSG